MLHSDRSPILARAMTNLALLLVSTGLVLTLTACESIGTGVSVSEDETTDSMSATIPDDTTDAAAATRSTDAETGTTLSQEDLMTQVVDALKSGDQGALEESWTQLITTVITAQGALTDTDIDALIWEAILKTGLIADTGIDSLVDLEAAIAAVESGHEEDIVTFENFDKETSQILRIFATFMKDSGERARASRQNIDGWTSTT